MSTCNLSIIAPTYNEALNIEEFISHIEEALGDSGWEIVFVDDDSSDGTAELLRRKGRDDRRIRCVRRVGRRGLSSACIEGMLASSGDLLAVMDADLQHDTAVLSTMMEKFNNSATDLVVATRYAGGGSPGDWDLARLKLSRIATSLGNMFLREKVSDPMSGYFMLRRAVFNAVVYDLSGIGFKILLDILASARKKPLRIEEVPYRFKNREKGESKLDNRAIWEFGMLIADKVVGKLLPVRFLAFSLVGAVGVAVHITVMSVLLSLFGAEFIVSHSIAALVAMICNFTFNNELTYSDRRLTGINWLKGLITFMFFCSIGFISNVGIAAHLYRSDTQWLLASLAGIVVGAVWNYSATKFYAWKS